jgi:hypothetical protein
MRDKNSVREKMPWQQRHRIFFPMHALFLLFLLLIMTESAAAANNKDHRFHFKEHPVNQSVLIGESNFKQEKTSTNSRMFCNSFLNF